MRKESFLQGIASRVDGFNSSASLIAEPMTGVLVVLRDKQRHYDKKES